MVETARMVPVMVSSSSSMYWRTLSPEALYSDMSLDLDHQVAQLAQRIADARGVGPDPDRPSVLARDLSLGAHGLALATEHLREQLQQRLDAIRVKEVLEPLANQLGFRISRDGTDRG